ncbi:MAG: FadR family transcriptional regulator [Opitutales bacterium]|nr:FadR family transcriptional regulator [Opitutales bacterium]
MRTRSTRVELVCRELADRILSGEYPVGSWLPAERKLSELMGVSRTVMREATRQLQSEGLIRIQHGKGISVVNEAHGSFEKTISRMVPDDVGRLQQLVEARMILEPEVAALAAERRTKVQLRKLKKIQSEFEAVESVKEGVEADLRFHTQLAEAADNHVIQIMLDACAQVSRTSRSLTLTNYPLATAVKHHQGILDAVEAGDGKLARRRMRRHIQHASSDLKTLIQEKEK